METHKVTHKVTPATRAQNEATHNRTQGPRGCGMPQPCQDNTRKRAQPLDMTGKTWTRRDGYGLILTAAFVKQSIQVESQH
jgi:hypothetical protein